MRILRVPAAIAALALAASYAWGVLTRWEH